MPYESVTIRETRHKGFTAFSFSSMPLIATLKKLVFRLPMNRTVTFSLSKGQWAWVEKSPHGVFSGLVAGQAAMARLERALKVKK